MDKKIRNKFSVNSVLLCIVKIVVGGKEFCQIYPNQNNRVYNVKNVMQNLSNY